MSKCFECGRVMEGNGQIPHYVTCKYHRDKSDADFKKAEPGELKADHNGYLFQGGVKVMRSYDYCHFEVQLSSSEPKTLKEIDNMRKEAARLADKVVEQYKEHRKFLDWLSHASRPNIDLMRHDAANIKQTVPESERTDEQKALIKKIDDIDYWLFRQYEYGDDWDDDYPELY